MKITDIRIVESLNQPAPWKWQNGTDYIASASIDTENDLEVHIDEISPDEWSIAFSREGPNGYHSALATGQGHEFKVFATVSAIIMSWWNEISFDGMMPDKISFTANKQAGDSLSRSKLYTRFAKKFAEKIEFHLIINDQGSKHDVFIFNRPENKYHRNQIA